MAYKIIDIFFSPEAHPTPPTPPTPSKPSTPHEPSTLFKSSTSPTPPEPSTPSTPRKRETETKMPTPLMTKSEAYKTETVKPSRPVKSEEEVEHPSKEEVTVASVKISAEGKKVSPVGEIEKLEEENSNKKEKFEVAKKIEIKAAANDEMEREEAALEGEDRETPGKEFVVTKITKETKHLGGKSVANDGGDEEEADLESERRPASSGTMEKGSTEKGSAKLSTKVKKITSSSTPSKNTEKVTLVKVERVPSRTTIEAKRSEVRQEDEEDEDLKADKVQKSTDGEKEIAIKVEKVLKPGKKSPGEKKINIKVEKIGPSTGVTKSEVSVKKVAEKPVVKSTVRDEPHMGKIPESVAKKSEIPVVKDETPEETEEEDLNSSKNNEKHAAFMDKRRSNDESQKTDEEIELELEGGRDKEERKAEKGKTDEQKIAHEFDKALKAERNREEEKPTTAQSVKPTTRSETIGTAKVQQVDKDNGRQTIAVKRDEADKELAILKDETASKEDDSKRMLSDEELELAELAQNAKDSEDKKDKGAVTEKPSISTPKEIVKTVNKISKVTVTVTKEKSKMSEEETKKGEKKLTEELKHEQKQEKAAVSIQLIVYFLLYSITLPINLFYAVTSQKK